METYNRNHDLDLVSTIRRTAIDAAARVVAGMTRNPNTIFGQNPATGDFTVKIAQRFEKYIQSGE